MVDIYDEICNTLSGTVNKVSIPVKLIETEFTVQIPFKGIESLIRNASSSELEELDKLINRQAE